MKLSEKLKCELDLHNPLHWDSVERATALEARVAELEGEVVALRHLFDQADIVGWSRCPCPVCNNIASHINPKP